MIQGTEVLSKTPEEGPLVKICGITNIDDARHAAECGADQLGFNFFSESPRYVPPEKAAIIIRQLPKSVAAIGVFVNELLEDIVDTVRMTGIAAIQLHGDEDAGFVTDVRSITGLDVIKAVRVKPGMDPEQIPRYWTGANAILLDKYSESERGGTGKQVDWDAAYKFGVIHGPIYLAGGLSADNIQDAIRKVRPHAVDACSRLESSLGKKDPEKVEAFIRNAKNA